MYCILLVNGVYIYYANYATDIHNKLDYKEFEFTGTFISIELIYIVGHLYIFTYCTYFPFISEGKNLYKQSTQLKRFERQYFSSWHNIIGVGMRIIYQTKPPLWYKTPQRWFKEGTLSGYRQTIKKVYFDLKSRCKEIKDHNFLPFLQWYDFA